MSKTYGKTGLTTLIAMAMVLLTDALLAGEVLAAGNGGKPATGKVVLSEKHFCRRHITFIPPKFTSGKLMKGSDDSIYKASFCAAPPTNWMQPDFDDSEWLLSRGRQFITGDWRLMRGKAPGTTTAHLRGGDSIINRAGLVCQRFRFVVKDRAKIKGLSLSLTYRGGFVAYLNGKEFGRGHLPEGKIETTTPAAEYPLEAWLYKDGKRKGKFLHAFDKKAPFHLRERTTGPVKLPVSELRDGENVLAIQLHRSDNHPDMAKKKGSGAFQRNWTPVGLSLLTLSADAPEGAVSDGWKELNGPRAWTVDVTKPVSTLACPDPTEKLSPVQIVAAANGVFSGQVVLADAKPLAGVSASVTALKNAEGNETIPASSIRIRYGSPSPFWGGGLDWRNAVVPPSLPKGIGKRFDVLLDKPPKDANSMPVWVTVNVPADAKAGLYKGELTVTAEGAKPFKAPIELNVSAWSLPDVKDFGALLMIYQSPETLAAWYKVKPWSEEHWKLIERSLKLAGDAGSVGLQFQILAKSCMGNEDSYIMWEKKADGTYGYDFTIFDRYLKTALKYHDPKRVKIVALTVWGKDAGSIYAGNFAKYGDRKEVKDGSVKVTVRNPDTGKKEDLSLPPFGTPECEKLLKPVLLAVKKRLEAVGLADRIMWGKGYDSDPLPSHVAMLDRILPGTPWYRESHWDKGWLAADQNDKKKRVRVGSSSIVWGGAVPCPAKKRLYGWRYGPKHYVFNFNRAGVSCLNLHRFPPPWSYHMWMESTIACGRNGNGNVGGDYWPIVKKLASEGRLPGGGNAGGWNGGGTFYGLYPASNLGRTGVGNNTVDLFGPGPDGPVSTIRFENALLGNQEAEARIFIERALLNKEKPVPAELAVECRRVLDERANILRLWQLGAATIAPYKWQERTRQLFDCAAKITKLAK